MTKLKKSGNNLPRREALAAVVGAGALAGTAALLGSPGVANAQSKKLQRMAISIGTTPHFGNVVVAHEGGHFKKHGLETDLTVFASGSVATEAFVGGQGNVVVAGDLPSLRLWMKGFIGITPQASYDQLSVIVARKELTKPEQFKGKKLGVLLGSTSEYFAGLFLASGGLKLSDVDLINLQPAEMVTGLASGDIDGFVIWQPFGWRAEKAIKDAHIVTTGAPFFHEHQMVTTSKEYAEKHEDELVAFIKGMRDAGDWISKNPDEAAGIISKFLRVGDPDVTLRMIKVINFSPAYTPEFRKNMDALSKFAKVDLNWDTMFDARFLKKVDPALVQL